MLALKMVIYVYNELKHHESVDISIDYYEEAPDRYDQVKGAIDSLGDSYRQLLKLFYFENQTWDTIASRLGYASASSARNQKYKCLKKIRKKIF